MSRKMSNFADFIYNVSLCPDEKAGKWGRGYSPEREIYYIINYNTNN